MAVKYQCPKCGRRWADWGAEKLGFKCPNCAAGGTDDVELVRVGSSDLKSAKRPSLKRTAARPALRPVVVAGPEEEEVFGEEPEEDTHVSEDDEAEFEDDAEIDDDEVFDDEEEDTAAGEEAAEKDDGIELNDLPFGDVGSPLGEDVGQNNDEWET